MARELRKYQTVEQSINKKFSKRLWRPFITALKQYELIQAGDRIAVCMSGGKDSFLLAVLMRMLQKQSEVPFDLVYLVMDPGYSEKNRRRIEENARLLEIPITVFSSDIFEVTAAVGGSPCYLCARMRRGFLYSRAQELGCNKIALGHHMSDVVETVLVSMFYGAQLQGMLPKLHSTNFPGMTLIRPLYGILEDDILAWAAYNGLHFIQCACRLTEQSALSEDEIGESKRKEVKLLIRELRRQNPNIDKSLFHAVHAVHLDTFPGYKSGGELHSFLEKFKDEEIVPIPNREGFSMEYLGISCDYKNKPPLDERFLPFGVWATAFLEGADRPFRVALERDNGKVSVYSSFLRGEEFAEANLRYLERTVKFLLWSIGGWKVTICGCEETAEKLRDIYRRGGERDFDAGFAFDVFERELELHICTEADFPAENEEARSIGGHLKGCRIGFDAGGSDRKVSAVIDGVSVYSEEVVWFPKQSEDPSYQYNGIVEAFKTAASKMPRVDAIGVSSAGTFVGNSPMVSSLFIKVPRARREEVKSVYDRAAREIGDVPIVVSNDGDVTALAGAMSLNAGAVMGIAMGTSEAAGYVTGDGKILGWFNELAFAPVDLQPDAPQDEWSQDYGVGCKYFSQDAVIRLAPRAGITLDEGLSLAEKLKEVQKLAEAGHEGARKIFVTIGSYLGHTLPLYARFYDLKVLLVLGRVASGIGGDLLIAECNRVLREEYPALAETVTVMLPDEKARRVGQSIAAASLPEV